MAKPGLGKRTSEVVETSAGTVFWTTVATTDITRTLKLYEDTIIVSTAAAAGTLTLPDVGEAKGQTFTIMLRTAGNNLTVQDNAGDNAEDWTDYTLDAANDNLCLYSNGRRWLVQTADEN